MGRLVARSSGGAWLCVAPTGGAGGAGGNAGRSGARRSKSSSSAGRGASVSGGSGGGLGLAWVLPSLEHRTQRRARLRRQLMLHVVRRATLRHLTTAKREASPKRVVNKEAFSTHTKPTLQFGQYRYVQKRLFFGSPFLARFQPFHEAIGQ